MFFLDFHRLKQLGDLLFFYTFPYFHLAIVRKCFFSAARQSCSSVGSGRAGQVSNPIFFPLDYLHIAIFSHSEVQACN